MKTIPQRLADLRAALAAEGCDAYIMPSSDPHASEYAPRHYTSWEYFSGFKCENANLVVTADEAALWVDGRFFGAADAALDGTGVQSMHMGVKGVPTVNEWLAEKLGEGSVLGYTAENMPLRQLRELKKCLEGEGVVLKGAHCDDDAWTEDRPALPATEIWLLHKQFAGLDTAEKLSLFREKLDKSDCAIVTKLDSIAWLLNLRANDIGNTPYALAFCFVGKEGAVLFTELSRVPENVAKELADCGVSLAPYESAPDYVADIAESVSVLIDPDTLNAALYNVLEANPNCSIITGKDPIQMLKAVKNETELESTRRAHLADGAAMVRFEMELEKRLAAGEKLRETDIGPMLLKYRSMDSRFIEESFGTIAAYGANAAMMHYDPEEGSDAEIEPKGFLLVDCGGTYYDGTTDITRTYTVGEMTDWEKETYTLVLRSHIDMAMAVWKAGMVGKQLDMLARQPIWARMLDYRCGTGHSVSHVGAVHEGPHSLRPTNDVAFVPGMVITDEPGYYEEGVVGIRIENELVCVDAGESEYGAYLRFEPLMYAPINLQPVLVDELSKQEKAWLNAYHEAVYEKLSPRLDEEEREWLKNKCAAI